MREWGTIWGRFLYQVDKTGIISPSFHTFDWENYYVQNVFIPAGTKAGQVFAHQAPTKVSIQVTGDLLCKNVCMPDGTHSG